MCYNNRAVLQRCHLSRDNVSLTVFNTDRRQCIEPFKCPQSSGQYRHYFSDAYYYRCHNWLPVLHHCPADHIYDGVDRCVPYFQCPELGGNYLFPGKPDQYFECCYGRATRRQCPSGELFDGKQCEPGYKCPHPMGRYPHPVYKNQYYECKYWESKLHTCSEGTVFDGKYACIVGTHQRTGSSSGRSASYTASQRRHYTTSQRRHYTTNQRRHNTVVRTVRTERVPQSPAAASASSSHTEFQCPRSWGNYPCPYDSTQYYQCQYNRPNLRSCPRRQVFDGSRCSDTFVCPRLDGWFRHPTRENQYYQCVNGQPCRHDCPPGEVFDGHRGCRRPYIPPTIEFRCPKSEGLFPSTTSNTQFYQCINMVATLHTCPHNTYFNGHSCVCYPSKERPYCGENHPPRTPPPDVPTKGRGWDRRVFEQNGMRIVDQWDSVSEQWRRTYEPLTGGSSSSSSSSGFSYTNGGLAALPGLSHSSGLAGPPGYARPIMTVPAQREKGESGLDINDVNTGDNSRSSSSAESEEDSRVVGGDDDDDDDDEDDVDKKDDDYNDDEDSRDGGSDGDGNDINPV
ncbi:uncharacterized protein LOC128960804 [Oppia nitens]|uniref:uncharacterized protein LOC128960803 n=1 Tax=Oppia nitens TaxID=1686743 RepID=UPI0023DA6143|nr:uncharacterized protein LOC128960803 [Oppia nitens]XP_054162916.1 uncharacterized protein LOC128960804 [Oppia nitens]